MWQSARMVQLNIIVIVVNFMQETATNVQHMVTTNVQHMVTTTVCFLLVMHCLVNNIQRLGIDKAHFARANQPSYAVTDKANIKQELYYVIRLLFQLQQHAVQHEKKSLSFPVMQFSLNLLLA